jgi:hypothetical protein
MASDEPPVATVTAVLSVTSSLICWVHKKPPNSNNLATPHLRLFGFMMDLWFSPVFPILSIMTPYFAQNSRLAMGCGRSQRQDA